MKSRMSVSFISMIERGERSPSYETLVQLAEALEVPLAELFRTGNEEPYEDRYFRRLVDFAQTAHLSRKQVDRLISVARAMFDLDEGPKASEADAPGLGPDRQCSVPGCGRPILAKGMCPSHYHRKLRANRRE